MQDYNPPFTPRIKSWEDTKYFDDEGPISDIDSGTSEDEVQPSKAGQGRVNKSSHQQEPQNIVPETPQVEKANMQIPNTCPIPKKAREQKRPRDKILRDENCGRTALDMRKNSAFIGYSYRRPKNISEVIEEALENEGRVDLHVPSIPIAGTDGAL